MNSQKVYVVLSRCGTPSRCWWNRGFGMPLEAAKACVAEEAIAGRFAMVEDYDKSHACGLPEGWGNHKQPTSMEMWA